MRPGIPALALLVVLLAAPCRAADGPDFDAAAFGELPVLSGGRIKPLDTVARNSLLRIRGKQTIRSGGKRIGADRWLLDVVCGGARAGRAKVFVIEDPDVLGLMGVMQKQDKYYSYEQLEPYLDEIQLQAERAGAIPPGQRTRFASAVYDLSRRLGLYQQLRYGFWFPESKDPAAELAEYEAFLKKFLEASHAVAGIGSKTLDRAGRWKQPLEFLADAAYFEAVPPAVPGSDDWSNVGEVLLEPMLGGGLRRGAGELVRMAAAYRKGDAAGFDRHLREYRGLLEEKAPDAVRRARHEALFNRMQPFYWGMILYLLVFLAGSLSWLGWTKPLSRAAFALLAAAFLVHTAGIISRMVLQGRPPVTNLYSSAVFVGWVGAGLSLVLERLHRRGVAGVLGASVGFCSLLIAHHLAAGGDTMEMMQAVLDSNFWLTTHVVTIIIGYGATFLAGAVAHVYILRRLFSRMGPEAAGSLEQMAYGVLCFALLFTFLGTVLGGIWADQSWGRFWGWDPKENGALLLVLWQSVILHARSGRYIRAKGLMVMAVFGNIVTGFSWFGVNMLGIGLHSYGFMDRAFFWLSAFILSQFLVMSMAALPAGRLSPGRLRR